MSAADEVQVTTFVAVDPETAFEVFTREVDAWWRSGPRFRWLPEPGGRLRFEPGVGGRFLEESDDTAPFEVGRIRVWEPPHRLVFSFRAREFAAGESTEVEVQIDAEGGGARLRVRHRGWSRLRQDHPVRRGMDEAAFRAMMGLWWGDLLTAARARVDGRRVRT